MSVIFISYRRADTSAHAGRLYDRLSERFGADRVVIDIDAIDAGADFVARTEDTIAQSAVVLALIGPHWLTRVGWRRRPRLADPGDFVRLELESALRHGALVIPVLVQGARFPSAGSLPPSLRALARRNAIELSDQRWRYDCDRLISTIQRTALPAEEADRSTGGSPARDRAVEQTRRGAAAGARRQDADRGDRADATCRGPPEPEPSQSRMPAPSSATRGADRPWWLRLVGVLALVGTLIAAVVVGVQLVQRGSAPRASVNFKAPLEVPISKRDYLERIRTPSIGVPALGRLGALATFQVTLRGLEGKEVMARELLTDARGRIRWKNDERWKGTQDPDSRPVAVWAPLPRTGRFRLELQVWELGDARGRLPLGEGKSPEFRPPAPRTPGR